MLALRLGLALRERMAKAFFILCMSETLVAPDALHVIVRQGSIQSDRNVHPSWLQPKAPREFKSMPHLKYVAALHQCSASILIFFA